MKRLIFILALLCAALPAFATTYAYSGKIQFAAASGGSALTNYTTVAQITDATLKPNGSGGQILYSGNANSLGPTVPYDLIFTQTQPSGTSCTASGLNWEIESWDQTNGIVTVFIGPFSSYSASTGPLVYFCYGSSSVTTYQGGAAGAAWDTGYGSIVHLGYIAATRESTANAVTLTPYSVTSATGQINGGVTACGSTTCRIYLSSNAANKPTTTITISGWINMNAVSTGWGGAWGCTNGSNGYGFHNNAGNSGAMEVNIGTSYYSGLSQTGAVPTNNTWHYYVGLYDGAHVKLYYDGAYNTQVAQTGAIPQDTTNVVINESASGTTLVGINDEIRIYNGVLPDGWIATDFANQSAISTFAAVSNIGPLSAASTVTITPIIL